MTSRLTDTIVGFVGLGSMGSRMAPHLAGAHELLLHDVEPSVAKRVSEACGARAVAQLSELAPCQVVVVMLPNSDIVDAVLHSDFGLFATLAPGSFIIDMSSSDPIRTQANFTRARELGLRMVDAPVSGGPKGALAGSLAVMVGCEEEDYDEVLPVLSTMSGVVTRAGGPGCGHVVKAVNNTMFAANFVATAEAFTAATRFGIDPIVLREIVGGSSGGSFVVNSIWPNGVESGSDEYGFAMGLMLKDARIGHHLITATQTRSPVIDAAVATWADGVESTSPQADITRLAHEIAAKNRSDGPAS